MTGAGSDTEEYRTSSPSPGCPQDWAREFAEAMAIPGKQVLLLDERNKGRWVSPLEAALATGRSFAIVPAPDLVVIDVDEPESAEQARLVAHQCFMHHGLRPVVAASGQAGHLHIFARAESLEDARACKAELQQTFRELSLSAALRSPPEPGGDARGACIRPPFSPHRHSGFSALIQPVDPAEALALLRPTAETESAIAQARAEAELRLRQELRIVEGAGPLTDGRPRELSPSMRMLLRTGRRYGKDYASGSEVTMALALGAANAGWQYEDLRGALARPEHQGGEAYRRRARDRPPRDADRWLWAMWRKALEYIEASPARKQMCEEDALLLEATRAARLAGVWKGQGAATDRAVLGAVLDLAERQGTLEPQLPCRTVADLAGVAAQTASRSLGRLTRAGWLVRGAERSHPLAAQRYHIQPGLRSSHFRGDIGELQPPETPLRPRKGEVVVSAGSASTGAVHSSWRWRAGLGLAALQVWEALGNSRLTVRELAARLGGRSRASVAKQLSRLSREGLVARSGKRGRAWLWVRGEPSQLDEVALRRGAVTAANRQRRRHIEERMRWSERMAREAHEQEAGAGQEEVVASKRETNMSPPQLCSAETTTSPLGGRRGVSGGCTSTGTAKGRDAGVRPSR